MPNDCPSSACPCFLEEIDMTIKMTKCKKDKDLYWYKDTDGKKKYAYRYRYKDSLGKYKEKSRQGFDNESSAYRELLTVKAKVLEQDFKELDALKLTVSTWMDMYIDSKRKEWKPNTLTNSILYSEKHIKRLIGHMNLSKLDRVSYIQLFINPLLEQYEPGTVRSIHDFCI